MARPKKFLRPKDYDRIKEWSAAGTPKKAIARALRMATDTLDRILREDERAARAYDEGLESERVALHGELRRQAIEDHNTVAALFLLKCRHGYREQAPIAPESRITVEMRLPGPLQPGDYARVIEHEPPAQLTHEVSHHDDE